MPAFYTEKGWYKSKTIWTAILGVLLQVFALFGVVVPTDAGTLVNGVSAALFALAGLFRYQATEEVVLSSPEPAY